jgi:type II secretory pathway pseudopilin PulG
MSIVNLILGQQLIVITIMVAVLLLLLAVMLTVMGRMRTRRAKQARLKAKKVAAEQAAQAAQAALLAQAAHIIEQSTGEVILNPKKPVSPAAVGSPSVTVPPASGASAAPVMGSTAPAVGAPVAAAPAHKVPGSAPIPVVAVPVTSTAPATDGAPPVSSAMQDILSSVFVDEESVARYEVLSRGLEPIKMADLQAMCQEISSRLSELNAN